MKLVSTNIAKARTILWLGEEEQTGIYKEAVAEGIFLEENDVKGDHVIDRRYHGGIDKACYLYSSDHYPYWQEHYPELEFSYGMFGENLTVEGLDERDIKIGDQYRIGEAVVEVSQPRQPCYKLGIRFDSQKVLRQMVRTTYSGVYVRVLEEGLVKKGYPVQRIHRNESSLYVSEILDLLYHRNRDQDLFKRAMFDERLAESCKAGISGV